MMEEEVVIGNWIREKVLGSGTFGIVSLWRNLKSNEEFAVKMCKWADDSLLTPKHKERWSKEVEMMNQIKHDNIIGTRSIPSDLEEGLNITNVSKLPILCMEYCSLGDLRQVLNKPENSNGLPEKQVRSILRDMKNAISYLHSLKITHRDLKPENILLHHDRSSESDVTYKLIDLGYAKEIDSNSVCASFVGTLQYLAPELLYSKTYSNTVDYWSFGLVAFEVITGIRPFLPNLPPVQWMQYVKKKTPEQICVFENLRGEVEYTENTFTENYVSSCFKDLIEKWLRIALDWDPKKRGHNTEDKSVKFLIPGGENGVTTQETAKESSLVIFSLLDVILSKKVLTIFSTVTYEHLSYEIDDSTLFSTVQTWVERDTKVPLEKHLFISKSFPTTSPLSLAHQYWNDQTDSMMYFFQVDCFVSEKVQPKIPPKLKYCLENPKLKLSFSLLIGVFASSLYFIKNQRNLYETLISAHSLRIVHLKNEVTRLQSTHSESDKTFIKLMEKYDILSCILDLNNQCLNSSKDSAQLPSEYKLLLTKIKNLKDKAMKLIEAWSQLTTRLQSAARRCAEIDEKEIVQKLSNSSFSDLENYAYNYIIQVRKIARDERALARPCLDAVKIVYKCLKVRDILLQNIQKHQTMQKILDINLEVEKMQCLVKSATENASELSLSLSNVILEKEKLTLKCLLTNLDSSYLPTTLPHMNGHQEKRSRINFKIGEAVRSPQPSYAEPMEKNEIESLVNDNLNIRLASQVFMQQCFDKYKSIQEDMDIDFSYLDDS